MGTDRSLATLLRALQSPSTEQDASMLLSSATTLLTLLSNPLNITLLTSQLLTAPAVWHGVGDLRAVSRVVGVFNAASLEKIHQERRSHSSGENRARERLGIEQWIRAIVQGADDKSPRWKHTLVLGGLFTGFESQERHGLPLTLRRTLEGATVKATNLAIEEVKNIGELSSNVLCMVLGYVFDTLENGAKQQLHHSSLLPLLMETILFSRNGLQWGYFLGTVDMDVSQGPDSKFGWSARSPSYLHIQRMVSEPVVASLGSLSRLLSFCIANTKDDELVFRTSDGLTAFTKSVRIQWQQNKLSEIDVSEESLHLSEESKNGSLPLLWQVLKSTLFATIIIQTSIIGRLISQGSRPHTNTAIVAALALHTLRNLYFISSRLGHNAFSQYSYVYLASVDILSNYPEQAELFIRDIQPTCLAGIPEHPQERCQDLYFLNVAELFALFSSPTTSEELLLRVAYRYLNVGNDSRLLEIFEAAHSVVLAVFCCPQNHGLVVNHLPAYISNLFGAFPQGLSSRQFRLTIRTLVRISAPPSHIAETQPLLSSTILELVRSRINSATTALHLPSDSKSGTGSDWDPLTEREALVLSLIDSLPFLAVPDLEEWLPLVAESINTIEDSAKAQLCRERLWEVFSNGEMDVAHAQICVNWWNTFNGRQTVLHGEETLHGGPLMSRSLGEVSKPR